MKHPGIIGTACAAINCDIQKDKHSARFFPFPSDINRCRVWLLACRRLDLFGCQPEVISSNYYLCENHFNPADKVLIHGKCHLKSNAMPVLFDFPIIDYQTTLIAFSSASASLNKHIGKIWSDLKFTSATRVVILPDKKIFICGGPVLYPGHLRWNAILKMFIYDNQLGDPWPPRGPIIVGIVDMSKKPMGRIVSYELFNICSKFIETVVETDDLKLPITSICEKIKLRLTEKDHLPDNILLKFLDAKHQQEMRNDPIPSISSDRVEVDKFFAMVPVAPPLPSLEAAVNKRKKPNILRSRKKINEPIPVYEKRLQDSSLDSMSKPIILTAKKPVVKLEGLSKTQRKQVPESAEDLNVALEEADNNPLKLLISAAHTLGQDKYHSIPVETVMHDVPIRSEVIPSDIVEVKHEVMDCDEYSIYDSTTLEEMASVKIPASCNIDMQDPNSHVIHKRLASTEHDYYYTKEKSNRISKIYLNKKSADVEKLNTPCTEYNPCQVKEGLNEAQIINVPSELKSGQTDVPVSKLPKKLRIPLDNNLPEDVKKLLMGVSSSSKVSVLVLKDPNLLKRLKDGSLKFKPEYTKLISSSPHVGKVSQSNNIAKSLDRLVKVAPVTKGNPIPDKSITNTSSLVTPCSSSRSLNETCNENKSDKVGSESKINEIGDAAKSPDESVNNTTIRNPTVNQLYENMPSNSSISVHRNANISEGNNPSESLNLNNQDNDDVICLGDYVREDEGDVVCLGEREQAVSSKTNSTYERVITTDGRIVTVDSQNIDLSSLDVDGTEEETEKPESASILLQEIQKMAVTDELKNKIKCALKKKPNLLNRHVTATRKLIKIPVNNPKQLSKKYISKVLSKVVLGGPMSSPFVVSSTINPASEEKDILGTIDRIHTTHVNIDPIPGEVEICSNTLPVNDTLSSSNVNPNPVPETVCPESIHLNQMLDSAESVSVSVSGKNNYDVHNMDEGTVVMSALLSGNSVLVDSNPEQEKIEPFRLKVNDVIAKAKQSVVEPQKKFTEPLIFSKPVLTVLEKLTPIIPRPYSLPHCFGEAKISTKDTLPQYLKDLIHLIASGKKVSVIKEKITKPIAITCESQPSEVIIGDGLSIKLGLCSPQSEEIPDQVKSAMMGKKIENLILMKECRKDSLIPEIIHPVRSKKCDESQITLAPCSSEETHTIPAHDSTDEDDRLPDTDIEPPDSPFSDCQEDSHDVTEPVNAMETDSSNHPENTANVDNCTGSVNTTNPDNSKNLPHDIPTTINDKLTELSLNKDNLPESIKNLMKTAPPSGVKILMVKDPSLLKGKMQNGGFVLSSELKDAIKSAAPNSGKVVIVKGKNLKDIDLAKMLQQQNTGNTYPKKTLDNKPNSSKAPTFVEATLPQTPPVKTTVEQPLTKNIPKRCYCLGYSLPPFRNFTPKKLEKVPMHYRELAENIITLRKELAVAKKKILRYGKLVKEIKERPPKVKTEHLLLKLKTLLNHEAYELVASTILNQDKQSHGHRFSDTVKKIGSDIALMGGWAPLEYLSKIFAMPVQKSVQKFICKQLVTPEDLADAPTTNDNLESEDPQTLIHVDEILNKVCNESSAGTLEPSRCIRSFVEHKKWRNSGFRFQDPTKVTEEEINTAKKLQAKRMYRHMLLKSSNNNNNSNKSKNKKSKKVQSSANKGKKSPAQKRPIGSHSHSPNSKRKKSNPVNNLGQHFMDSPSYSKSGKFGKVIRSKTGNFETDEMIEASVEELRRNTLQEMFGSGSERPTITWKYKEVPYAANAQVNRTQSEDHRYSEALDSDHDSMDEDDLEAQTNLLLQQSQGSLTPNYNENLSATPVKDVPVYFNYHLDVVASNVEL